MQLLYCTPPTAVMRLLTTARLKWIVGHFGRLSNHSFVLGLYDITCLVNARLKYAMLPHTVAEPLHIVHGAV